MADLEWEAPPPRRGATGHEEIASTLRSRPKQWAVVYETEDVKRAYDFAANIKHARLIPYRPAGAYEATTRRGQNGHPAKVYARYVGDPVMSGPETPVRGGDDALSPTGHHVTGGERPAAPSSPPVTHGRKP